MYGGVASSKAARGKSATKKTSSSKKFSVKSSFGKMYDKETPHKKKNNQSKRPYFIRYQHLCEDGRIVLVWAEKKLDNGQVVEAFIQPLVQHIKEHIHDMKNDGFLSCFPAYVSHVYRRSGRESDKPMMTGTPGKDGREYGWRAIPFRCRVKAEHIETFCKELVQNVADLCSANNKYNTVYQVHPTPCANQILENGRMYSPPCDHCVTDLGVVDIIKEKFYEGEDDVFAANGPNFAVANGEVAHWYFTPLNDEYSVTAQQLGYINPNEMEIKEEAGSDEDSSNGSDDGENDGVVAMEGVDDGQAS